MTCEQVILIGGTGRSGTNILKSILGAHSSIATLPFEYRFIIDPEGIIDFYNTYPAFWSPYGADARTKRLEKFLLLLSETSDAARSQMEQARAADPKGLRLSHPPYAGWELNRWIPGYAELVKKLIHELTEFRYSAVWPGTPVGVANNEMIFAPPMSKGALLPILQGFLRGCFDSISSAQQKPVFAEDNTHNILFASDLLNLIPNARLIHVVRDPRDVVASLLDQRWAPRQLDQAMRWYVEVMKKWDEQKAICEVDSILEVRLVDLVADSKTTLDRIAAFCHINVEPEMMSIDLSKHHSGRYKENSLLSSLITNSEFKSFVERYGSI